MTDPILAIKEAELEKLHADKTKSVNDSDRKIAAWQDQEAQEVAIKAVTEARFDQQIAAKEAEIDLINNPPAPAPEPDPAP